MQGISGWEWGSYAYKNMIFGTHQFFEWLEKTSFANDAMQHLWQSYYNMAGKLFFRMLHYHDEHKGLDIVLDKAIPVSASQPLFWNAFTAESKLHFDTEHDARHLSELVTQALAEKPNARIGLWGVGVLSRGRCFVKSSPHLHKNLVWIADRDLSLHGSCLDQIDLHINHPNTLQDVDLDILVIGARQDFIDEIIRSAAPLMKTTAIIISVNGREPLHAPKIGAIIPI